jgi:hypothetical protein
LHETLLTSTSATKVRSQDLFARSLIFTAIRLIAERCGWLEELQSIYKEVQDKHKAASGVEKESVDDQKPSLDEEVDKLAAAIGEASLKDESDVKGEESSQKADAPASKPASKLDQKL